MDNKIYREKSIKKISSPEELSDYMKVTTPRVWIVLLAVIAILIGAVVWGMFGSVTITDENGEPKEVKPITFIIN
ncbi:MAG: hypothetical protein IK118_04200 [Clostridia bacterium]|nr:hypothetical protein [Clostridia bacterium]